MNISKISGFTPAFKGGVLFISGYTAPSDSNGRMKFIGGEGSIDKNIAHTYTPDARQVEYRINERGITLFGSNGEQFNIYYNEDFEPDYDKFTALQTAINTAKQYDNYEGNLNFTC